MTAETATPQERMAKMQPVIAEMVEAMNKEITQGALEAGWSAEEAADLARSAQPPFFDLLIQGVPAPLALMEATAYADRLLAARRLKEAMARGASPQEAFAQIKAMKLKVPGNDDSVDAETIAAAAQKAFDEAMAKGESPEEALFSAYDAAAKAAAG